MSDIRKKLGEIAQAPTPQNTPASITGSYLKQHPQTQPTIAEEPSSQLLSLIQGKLGTLVGKDSGYIDSLPKSVKNRVAALEAIQKDHLKLEEEFQKELLELEKKYFKKYEPLYNRRRDIVNGDVEPTEEEIEKGKALHIEEAEEGEDEEKEDTEEDSTKEEETSEDKEDVDIKGIANFWLTTMENLRPLSDIISERDTEALVYLSDIQLKYLDTPGFSLNFHFKSNPYFSNEVLTKSYYYQEELGYTGEFVYDHATGDKINWKSSEKNLTITVEKRKQRNKHTKQTRVVEKITPIESFFNFSSPPTPPSPEQDEEEEENEEEDDLEERLELDYQLGEEIKDKLIPRAIDWFTGSALEYDDFDELYEDGSEEDEDEDDDDDDDDDDEEDEEEGAADGKKQEPSECKQT